MNSYKVLCEAYDNNYADFIKPDPMGDKFKFPAPVASASDPTVVPQNEQILAASDPEHYRATTPVEPSTWENLKKYVAGKTADTKKYISTKANDIATGAKDAKAAVENKYNNSSAKNFIDTKRDLYNNNKRLAEVEGELKSAEGGNSALEYEKQALEDKNAELQKNMETDNYKRGRAQVGGAAIGGALGAVGGSVAGNKLAGFIGQTKKRSAIKDIILTSDSPADAAKKLRSLDSGIGDKYAKLVGSLKSDANWKQKAISGIGLKNAMIKGSGTLVGGTLGALGGAYGGAKAGSYAFNNGYVS